MRIAIGFLFGALLCVLAGSPGHLTKQTAHAEAAARKVATRQRVVQSQPEKAATAEPLAQQPAPEPPQPLTEQENLLQQAGIPRSDWAHVDYVVTKESSWRPTAINPESGATGLCQSLPAEKMATEGADYMTNPVTQLRWCHKYAQQRYGSWKESEAFWRANQWW